MEGPPVQSDLKEKFMPFFPTKKDTAAYTETLTFVDVLPGCLAQIVASAIVTFDDIDEKSPWCTLSVSVFDAEGYSVDPESGDLIPSNDGKCLASFEQTARGVRCPARGLHAAMSVPGLYLSGCATSKAKLKLGIYAKLDWAPLGSKGIVKAVDGGITGILTGPRN
jgi:hypothetical protein